MNTKGPKDAGRRPRVAEVEWKCLGVAAAARPSTREAVEAGEGHDRADRGGREENPNAKNSRDAGRQPRVEEVEQDVPRRGQQPPGRAHDRSRGREETERKERSPTSPREGGRGRPALSVVDGEREEQTRRRRRR
jgi:hypothetical protein